MGFFNGASKVQNDISDFIPTVLVLITRGYGFTGTFDNCVITFPLQFIRSTNYDKYISREIYHINTSNISGFLYNVKFNKNG